MKKKKLNYINISHLSGSDVVLNGRLKYQGAISTTADGGRMTKTVPKNVY